MLAYPSMLRGIPPAPLMVAVEMQEPGLLSERNALAFSISM